MKSQKPYKLAPFIIIANIYFYYAMTAIYGISASLNYHYEFPTLHLLELTAVKVILGSLNIGVILVVLASYLKIDRKIVMLTAPLYCVFYYASESAIDIEFFFNLICLYAIAPLAQVFLLLHKNASNKNHNLNV